MVIFRRAVEVVPCRLAEMAQPAGSVQAHAVCQKFVTSSCFYSPRLDESGLQTPSPGGESPLALPACNSSQPCPALPWLPCHPFILIASLFLLHLLFCSKSMQPRVNPYWWSLLHCARSL